MAKEQKLKVGDLVRNYVFVAEIVGFHKTGNPILRGIDDGLRWLAPEGACVLIAVEAAKADGALAPEGSAK